MAKRGGKAADVPLSRFGVLVAQLESIVASAPQQPPDALLCFDLLSELVSAIEEEPKEAIVHWQRKCEDALYSLLVLGARRPVRRLASLAMVRVIAKGDHISIYSRVSSLQGWLAEGKRSEPLSCAGAAQCLGEIYRVFGRRITSGLTETTSIASKLMKFHEVRGYAEALVASLAFDHVDLVASVSSFQWLMLQDFVRQDALLMLQNALEGSCGSGAPATFCEAFRIITRVAVGDKAYNVRLAAARCLKTFANIKGPGLGIAELENAASYCIKALEDPASSVRDAFAEALGAILALGMNPQAQMNHKGRTTGPPKKLEGGLQKYLIVPFMKASGVRAKDVHIGLTLSWVFFLQLIHLKYHFSDSELQDFALQAMEMLQSDPLVDAHALACVLYILRVGVTDQMTEPTQRTFLVLLGRQLESPDLSPSIGVAVLRILSYLLTTLGEVPLEFKEILDNTVVAALSHSSIHVRVEASLTLRTLAEVDPTCVGGLISYGVTTLNALRDSASIEKGNRLKLELDSLHGQATALAALVSISPRLLLGYPARLPKSVFEVSKKMLTERRRNIVAAAVEKEAGWLLLASLITSMPKKELEDQVFDILLLWAGPFAGNIEVNVEAAQDLNSELRILSVALEALTAFIKSFVSPTISTSGVGVLLQPVLVYLSGALSCIRFLRTWQKQSAKPSLDMFTIRTLIAYQSLLDPLTYKADHYQIIEICSTPFSDPHGCEESSCLRLLLDKRDVYLGPWTPGRDWLEDELRAFEGGKDGILPCLWEDQVPCFPQPENVSKMLVNQMLLCLGSIFATMDNGERLKLLNMIDQCLRAGKKHSCHAAVITNACVVLLAGIKAVLALRVQTIENEILSSMQLIFQSILAEGEIYAAQRRASCEGLGLLARLGNDSYTARMAHSLLSELATATDPSYIGSLALSLGCIHRSAGGMALSTLVPATVNSISSLARSSNAGMQLWSLHALLLTIEAAGLSYVSQVQATLTLAIDILLADENGSVDLRQGIGHLINAIVAVIGPELAPGSTFFSRCKSVVAETSSGQETSTVLESVRFTQQLVLFAPQAVSVHSHVQTLLPTLSSRQPILRHLAVSTLRHLIEKDPVTMIEERIEENLFRLLDEETDSEIGNLVRTTISRLLYASCPSCPSRWLALCRSMVLATSKGSNVSEEHASTEVDTSNGSSISVGDTRLYHGEDDENMIASSAGPKMQDFVSIGNIYLKGDKHLRYRTRVFAAECLSCLPQAVGMDPAHFDLMLARKHASKGHNASGDWLVLHLQELVSLAYQISTSQFEGMQPIGVKLLITIMDKFGRIPDPELPGHLLVEQYQAQFVSAIRSAVSISSGPPLLEAGLQLATKILTSSMLGGDRVALQRMFSLISRLLHDFDDLYYPSFAEWVACKIKTRLLAAHASIKCYVYTLLRERGSLPDEYLQLIPLFSDTSGTLGKYWICILKDSSYISFGIQSKLNDRPFLDGIQSPLVSSRVKACLDEAWPLILQALALDAVPVKFEMGLEDSPKQALLSGCIMVKLEWRQFDFLWGLALLTLFQSQKPAVDPGEKPFQCNGLMRSCGEPILEATKDSTLFEIALITLQSLSTEIFFNANFISSDLSKELLQVLLHGDHMAESWDNAAIPLFSKILQFCPDVFLDAEDFISLATELCTKYLYRACLRYNLLSHDRTIVEILISATLNAAERLVCLSSYQKCWKLKLAFLSTSYKCLQRTSTYFCSSKLIAFLRNMAPLFRKFFEDDALHDDACKILEVWARVVSDLSEDCIKKLHSLDKQTNDTWKLLAKKLAFCLEDAIFIARLAHEMLAGREENSRSIFMSLSKHCINCVKMALTDMNAKAIGLLMLKTIAQKEHGDSLDVKSHRFSLFFSGELLVDIFSPLQDTLKKPMSRESIVVCEECLRFLFLFHTLSQGHECFDFSMSLLLEGIFMISSPFVEVHLQEANEMKTMAMRLIYHLVQVPSTAAQIKEILLSMPTTRRQLLQDIIRSSVSQVLKGSEVASSIPSPTISLPVQLDVIVKQSPQELASNSAHLHSHGEATKEEIDGDGEGEGEGEGEIDDDVGSDDDWDAFQSFPAADISTASTQIETDYLLVQSPVLDGEHQPSGSTFISVSDEVINESLDGVKDNPTTGIENGMQDPLCSKPSTDDEHVMEAEDGKSELLDVSGPQPVDYDKDLENDGN